MILSFAITVGALLVVYLLTALVAEVAWRVLERRTWPRFRRGSR